MQNPASAELKSSVNTVAKCFKSCQKTLKKESIALIFATTKADPHTQKSAAALAQFAESLSCQREVSPKLSVPMNVTIPSSGMNLKSASIVAKLITLDVCLNSSAPVIASLLSLGEKNTLVGLVATPLIAVLTGNKLQRTSANVMDTVAKHAARVRVTEHLMYITLSLIVLSMAIIT